MKNFIKASEFKAHLRTFVATEREVWTQGYFTCTFVKVDGVGFLTIRKGSKTIEHCECHSVGFARRLVEHDYIDSISEMPF